MTKRQFWTAEKRALERLNPRVLGTMAAWDHGMVCAGGAFACAQASKGRMSPEQLSKHATIWYDLVLPAGLKNILESVNDNFDGPPAARWEHVYAFVCAKLDGMPA